ncbi:MAG: heme-copper oxidase subunit III [Acidobacteriales bacterium]|nr:heme-copper oxidase subunit III [Terriglobales bacterium]
MATFIPAVEIRAPQGGHGGSDSHPPLRGGGDGERGRNGGPDFGQRLRRARLGLAVATAPIVMLFVSFASAYIFRQGLPTLDDKSQAYVREWMPVNLPVTLLLVNTILLAVSSLTAELARRQITRQVALLPVRSIPGVSLGRETKFPWLGSTVVLGIGFLIGQAFAWRELAARGFYLATSASSSFVYLLMATHAVHLAGGVAVLLYAAAASLLGKSLESRRIVVDVTAWYWHFMLVLWAGIFALLEFAS